MFWWTLRKLRSSDNSTREHAIKELAISGDARAYDAILGMLRDWSPGVRRSAIGALEQIGDPRAVEPLIRMLSDKDPWCQEAAIHSLQKFGDTRAIGPLVAVLRTGDIYSLGLNDGEKKVVGAAIEALVDFQDAAVAALVDALQESS